eukprot:6180094-Pleurochrysis_carterae.AAC.1
MAAEGGGEANGISLKALSFEQLSQLAAEVRLVVVLPISQFVAVHMFFEFDDSACACALEAILTLRARSLLHSGITRPAGRTSAAQGVYR